LGTAHHRARRAPPARAGGLGSAAASLRRARARARRAASGPRAMAGLSSGSRRRAPAVRGRARRGGEDVEDALSPPTDRQRVQRLSGAVLPLLPPRVPRAAGRGLGALPGRARSAGRLAPRGRRRVAGARTGRPPGAAGGGAEEGREVPPHPGVRRRRSPRPGAAGQRRPHAALNDAAAAGAGSGRRRTRPGGRTRRRRPRPSPGAPGAHR